MSATLTEQICSALAQFSSATRLYALTVGDVDVDLSMDGLLVEAFASEDAVQGIGGIRTSFAGDISELLAMLGSEGGLARYRVRLVPWMRRLSQVRNSRVWQDKSVLEIVESIFEAYTPLAIWRWSDEAGPFLDDAVPRSYRCQYRKSDLAFVQRLPTEEGLAWRFEQAEDGPGAVLFSDTTQLTAVPEDPSSAADGGIRFHNVRAGERQDTVQGISRGVAAAQDADQAEDTFVSYCLEYWQQQHSAMLSAQP